MTIDGDTYKKLLGNWPSGVTIVTSRHQERQQGMTVSAFNEVSLDPPLVMVCADKDTITHELIQGSGVFSVSILAEQQDQLSNRFASKKNELERFKGLDCADGSTGCPRIPGAVAWLDCTVQQAIEAGDHTVYIGQVETCEMTERPPLLYFRSAYGKLA